MGLKIKRKADATFDKCKARLVAKGYSQQDGIDYDETFAPVVRMTSLRTVIAIAAAENMVLHQMDVDAAFLHGTLTEEIYMKQPEGFVDSSQPNKVCCLLKSIYGLKQASRVWYDTITKVLTSNGFTQSKLDHCIFTKLSGTSKIYVTVYVDDLLIAASTETLCSQVKQILSAHFSMKDLGPAHHLLGMLIKRDTNGITLSQDHYVTELLTQQHMQDCHSTPVPVTLSDINTLIEQRGEDTHSELSYKFVVGSTSIIAQN